MNCRLLMSRLSFFPLVLAAVLSGCGENATSFVSDSDTDNTIPLTTTAPDFVTIASGTSPSYAIFGGTSPYIVSSGNTSVATASVSGSVLTINGVATDFSGAVTPSTSITVFDAKGATDLISVTVSPVATTPLDVLPSAASGNVGDVLTFLVSGGNPSYTVTVNNPSIATVTPAIVATSGGQFTATLHNAGSTPVAIVDALGQTKTFTLTVNQLSADLRLSPSAFEVSESYTAPITLNIYGGVAPYTALTSDLVLSNVTVAGSVLTIGMGSQTSRCIDGGDADALGTTTKTVTITAKDALGASATSVMTIKDNYGVAPDCPL